MNSYEARPQDPPTELVDYTEFHADQDLAYLATGLRVSSLLLAMLGTLLLLGVALVSSRIGIASQHSESLTNDPGLELGQALVAATAAAALATLALSLACWLAGGYLKKRRRYSFCRATAAAVCLFFPVGTYFGGLTLLTMRRRLVREQFAASAAEGSAQVSRASRNPKSL